MESGNIPAVGQGADRNNKYVISKKCAPFTVCISDVHKIQVDNGQDLDVVMPMYNLIECNDNYSKH